MKTLLVTLMALALYSGNANAATESDTKRNVAKESAVTGASLASYQQLSEENKQLKAQLSNLENNTQELESTLNYTQMMSKMFSYLEGLRQVEQVEELKAEIGYNRMMAALFLQLQTR